MVNPFGRLYEKRKSDPDWAHRTIIIGLLSIMFSVACVVLAYFCVKWGVLLIKWTFTTFMGVFTYLLGIGHIFCFAIGLGLFVIPYYIWINGIVLVVMQLLLNRKWIGWLALIIWLASVVGIVYVSSLSFGALTGVYIFGQLF